jgi:serine protease
MTKQRNWAFRGLSIAIFGGATIVANPSQGANHRPTKRILVRLRSPATFQALHMQMTTAPLGLPSYMRDLFGSRAVAPVVNFPGTGLPVQKTLANLNFAVVAASGTQALEELRQNPEVLMAEEETFFPLSDRSPQGFGAAGQVTPQTLGITEGATTPWGIDAVKAREAWAMGGTGAQGEGAKVMILDTGIDRDHPDLRNRIADAKNLFTRRFSEEEEEFHGNPRNRDLGGGFLLGTGPFAMNILDDDDAEETAGLPYPYFDEVGHGTHVAGTIAAEDDGQGVVGVAPKSKLYMGRVCGRLGCSSVAVVEGINWAIQTSADVLSMSLGGPLPSNAQREALIEAERAGVVAVAASGNGGVKKISYPAAYPEVISVGAIDAARKRADFSQYGPRLDVVAPGVDVVSSVPLGTGRAAEVRLNGATDTVPSTSFVGSADAERGLTGEIAKGGLGKPADLTGVRGKIALLQRGDIPFGEKVQNAVKAGATAVMIYNNEPGLISGSITADGSTVAIPVVMIEQLAGEMISNAIAAGQAQSVQLATKKTNFSAMRGTSMATPHVSGVVALIRAANKKLTVAQVRQILKQTAVQVAPGADPDNEYGAGLVNAQAAVTTAISM